MDHLDIKNLLPLKEAGKKIARAAIFMSGSGTNAEKLLESLKDGVKTWEPVVIVTDFPEKSRAAEIGNAFGVPVLAFSIREFYRRHGESTISLRTEQGRCIREMWTEALREKLSDYAVDFGILAGFVPLSNITGDFPCLNVHPGDLTVEDEGKRLLVGLHTLPIERAILLGLDHMRSSVIIAQPYTGKGGEMDSGPILGVSPEVKIDFKGADLEQLKKINESRPGRKPAGGYGDLLEDIAAYNQELLKEQGDWVVLPKVVSDFAAGNFGVAQEQLYFRKGNQWLPVLTVEYSADKATLIQ
jgi:folate-dependent phosphoribosylglycinamide formyltransferase PurN